MRISDWSSDVCSSDLLGRRQARRREQAAGILLAHVVGEGLEALAAGGDEVLVEHPLAAVVPLEQPLVEQLEQPEVAVEAHLEEEVGRTAERRVGKECVSKCRSWRETYH